MVKLVENKKLLYGDCKWKYLRRKDSNSVPKIAVRAELVSAFKKIRNEDV